MAFHHNHLSQDLSFNHFTDQDGPPPPPPQQQQQQQHFHDAPPPNWLNTALLRSDNNNNFLNLHTSAANTTAATTSDSPSSAAANQWLSRSSSILQRTENNNSSGAAVVIDEGGAETMIGGENKNDGGGGAAAAAEGVVSWQNARQKAEILSHPLYEQLLSAHVACLRIATPVDQLPRIDAQLAQSQNVVAKYSALGAGQGLVGDDDKELDQFMVIKRFNFDIKFKTFSVLFCRKLICSVFMFCLYKRRRIMFCFCVLSKSNFNSTCVFMQWKL